jgi:hypothetical protein
MENASHKFTAERVQDKIKHEQEKYGWEFIFLAANIDAIETAEAYGIDRSRAVNYHADAEGTLEMYHSVNRAMRNVREHRSLDADSSWRDNVDADYKRRNKDK